MYSHNTEMITTILKKLNSKKKIESRKVVAQGWGVGRGEVMVKGYKSIARKGVSPGHLTYTMMTIIKRLF